MQILFLTKLHISTTISIIPQPRNASRFSCHRILLHLSKSPDPSSLWLLLSQKNGCTRHLTSAQVKHDCIMTRIMDRFYSKKQRLNQSHISSVVASHLLFLIQEQLHTCLMSPYLNQHLSIFVDIFHHYWTNCNDTSHFHCPG